jgi:hypothetical protein
VSYTLTNSSSHLKIDFEVRRRIAPKGLPHKTLSKKCKILISDFMEKTIYLL